MRAKEKYFKLVKDCQLKYLTQNRAMNLRPKIIAFVLLEKRNLTIQEIY